MATEEGKGIPEKHRGGVLTSNGYQRLNEMVSKLIPKSSDQEPEHVVVTLTLDRKSGNIIEMGTKKFLGVQYLKE